VNIILNIKSLCKSFTRGNTVLNSVDLSLEKGKILAIVGESGSGKTTLIRLISGLETPEKGSIMLNNTIVNSDTIFVNPEHRNIGMVFQDYALFPNFTVFENVVYGISIANDKEIIVNEVLTLVGLQGYQDRYPHQLSGGQQQRVALARALAPKPNLLILDEPFSNLDSNLRIQLRNEIFGVIRSTGVTAIFVTHDTQDAMAIADDIVVLKDGEIMQKGTARDIYSHPSNYYIGSLFRELVILSNSDLKCFGYQNDNTDIIALQIQSFKVNSNTTYAIKSKIVKNQFAPEGYLNTIRLKNSTEIRFYSDKDIVGNDIVIGFESQDLLIFKS
jgi:iron(III) transport system ATP-binding protein